MSRNNTGNPIGSKAFPDFEDNVPNLDLAINSDEAYWVDRLGRPRLPLMEQERQFVSDQERREGEFQTDQSSREAVFSDFLQASGYQDLGEYAPGIEITTHNQYVTFGGQPYLLKPSIPVPYTTSGAWTGDDFKLIGDDSLRQDLANPAIGAAMVGHGDGSVADYLGPYSGVLLQGDSVSDDHLLIRNVAPNSPTRVHQEPNGHVDQGTVTKFDWMFDPFDIDQVNYRIVNIYTKHGVGSGFNGQNGVAVFGAKGVGNHFGVFPTMNFGFSDDSANGVPMKLCYFDTDDTAWRTPMIGAWRVGRMVNAGDHILSDFNIYVATTSGTTGSVNPVHTSGTDSDGGVSWTFVRRYFNRNTIKPVVMFGDRDDMPKFGFPNARIQLSKEMVVWNGQKLKFLDNTGTAVWEIGVDLHTDDFHIRSLTGGGSYRFDAAGSFIQNSGLSYLLNSKAAAVGATSVDVKGTELVTFGNTSATSVTAFVGHPYQRFYVQSSNGQTTLVHGGNIKLRDAADVTLSSDTVLQFIMNSSGTVARQVL